MRFVFAAVRLIVAICLVAICCAACSVITFPFQVRPAFQVTVKQSRNPVQGLHLFLDSDQPGWKSVGADTDKNGIAYFHGIPPGNYKVRTDPEAGAQTDALIEVSSNGREDFVYLNWPRMPIIPVQSLKGRMRGPDFEPGKSEALAAIDLIKSGSSRVVKRVVTEYAGAFDFEITEPGLYFLSLKPSGLVEISGSIAVEVVRNAVADHLDIDMGWTDCGLWYVDRSQRELRLDRLTGRIADSNRGAISDSDIFLLESSGKLVERIHPDNEGSFSSPRSLNGTYQLLVSRPGFTPLRTTLRAEAEPGTTRNQSLAVKLGVGGACSDAIVE